MVINVDYTALGLPLLDGIPIGKRGTLNLNVDYFDYKPSLDEAVFCSKIFNNSMPRGKYWEAHNVQNTPDYALSVGVGEMIAVVLAYQSYIRKELDIDTTEDLITEWEESVGLPEPCSLSSAQTIEERRELVKLHLRKTPIVNVANFEEIVLKLTGYDVIILPRLSSTNVYNEGFDEAWLDFTEFGGIYGDRFTFDVFVDFIDEKFGFDIDEIETANLDEYLRPPYFIECVFNKIKPANSLAVYHYDSTLYQSIKELQP